MANKSENENLELAKPTSALLQNLRDATTEAHRSIESCLPLKRLFADDLTRDEYVQTLTLLFGFFDPLESHLRAQTEWAQEIPDIKSRWRADDLRRDLLSLGLESQVIDQIKRSTHYPQASSLGSFFGIFYVSEGSRLGGQLIHQRLSRFGFFKSANHYYRSQQVGDTVRWREFLRALQKEGRPEIFEADLIRSANQTFQALHHWMDSGQASS